MESRVSPVELERVFCWLAPWVLGQRSAAEKEKRSNWVPHQGELCEMLGVKHFRFQQLPLFFLQTNLAPVGLESP